MRPERWEDDPPPPRIDELNLHHLRELQREINHRITTLSTHTRMPKGEFVFPDGSIRVCTLTEYFQVIGWGK